MRNVVYVCICMGLWPFVSSQNACVCVLGDTERKGVNKIRTVLVLNHCFYSVFGKKEMMALMTYVYILCARLDVGKFLHSLYPIIYPSKLNHAYMLHIGQDACIIL